MVKEERYHSIPITLARQAVHYFFFPRFVYTPFLGHSSRILLMNLTCSNTHLDSMTPKKKNAECDPRRSSKRKIAHCSSSFSFAYIISVLMVSFVPFITSSPAWTRFRCWNNRIRPAFGATSIRRVSDKDQNVVAPPSSASSPSLPTGSLRYRCKVK